MNFIYSEWKFAWVAYAQKRDKQCTVPAGKLLQLFGASNVDVLGFLFVYDKLWFSHDYWVSPLCHIAPKLSPFFLPLGSVDSRIERILWFLTRRFLIQTSYSILNEKLQKFSRNFYQKCYFHFNNHNWIVCFSGSRNFFPRFTSILKKASIGQYRCLEFLVLFTFN